MEETQVLYHTTEEALELIESGKTGCCNYIWQDQFIFKKNRESITSKGAVFYLKCKDKNCNGSMVCRASSLVPISSTPHRHPPQKAEVMQLRFKCELRLRLRANPHHSSKQVYDEVAADPRFKETANLIRLRSTTSMLSRVRMSCKEPKDEPRTRIYYGAKGSQSEEKGQSQGKEENLMTWQEKGSKFDPFLSTENSSATDDEMAHNYQSNNIFQTLNNKSVSEVETSESTLSSKATPSGQSDDFIQLGEDNQPLKASADVNELKSVVHKLEEISNKLVAATIADTYENFGRYIGTLLRGLHPERAQRIMENIVSDVLSAKFGFEVRAQPTERASFAEPTAQHIECGMTKTSEKNVVEVLPCQLEGQFSSSPKKDLHSLNIPSSGSGFSTSSLPISSREPLEDNKRQRLCKSMIETSHEETVSSNPPQGLKQAVGPSQDVSSAQKLRSQEHADQTLEENIRLRFTNGEFKSNLEDRDEGTFNIFSSNSYVKQEVECDPVSLMPDVVMVEGSASAPSTLLLFLCTRCGIYFHSSDSLRRHFSVAHPGQSPSFKVKQPPSEVTNVKRMWQQHSPQFRRGT